MYVCDKEFVNYNYIKLLIDNNANINEQNKSGQTALTYAIRNRNFIEIIELLIDNNVCINVIDNACNAPLHVACNEPLHN